MPRRRRLRPRDNSTMDTDKAGERPARKGSESESGTGSESGNESVVVERTVAAANGSGMENAREFAIVNGIATGTRTGTENGSESASKKRNVRDVNVGIESDAIRPDATIIIDAACPRSAAEQLLR